MNIPLIVWGENASNEQGGPATDIDNSFFTRREDRGTRRLIRT